MHDNSKLEQSLAQNSKSEIAKEICKLQKAVRSSIDKRERLPQPMFWSLLFSRLQDIKRQQKLKRSIEEILLK